MVREVAESLENDYYCKAVISRPEEAGVNQITLSSPDGQGQPAELTEMVV
jgi:hypothetical protein